jgi:LuxR family maltose regulon positive regulatory protein
LAAAGNRLKTLPETAANASYTLSMPTLLESKLYMPEPAGDHIARSRLYAQLDQPARRRLTLLCAPAGFGKTTLAATWLRRLLATNAGHVPLRAAWYTIDEQDDDLLTFVRYLVAAIQAADADLLRNWVELDQRPEMVIPEQLADQLAAELQNIEGQLVVALDDYNFVANEQIHRLISQLLRHLPPTMHLVITSRYDPPIGLTLLRLRGEIAEMRATGLAFTRDEAAVFLHGAIGSDIEAAEADVVWRQTEGWAAGLRLAAISMSGTVDRKRFVRDFARSTSRHVADYLMDQVLASQPPDVEHFLLRTSPSDRLCPALCAVMAEISFSEAEAALPGEPRPLFAAIG